jgi:hypothetical protein
MATVPNHSQVVIDVYDTGDYDLKTHDGLAAYVDDCVVALHKKDPNWGHLRKNSSQTNIHGHAEDAALYKHADDKAQAVDFVSGAGGSNPKPGWLVDTYVYKHSDWLNPGEHQSSEVPMPPQKPTNPVPSRDEALDEMNYLDYYYTAPEGLQRPNGLSIDGKPDFEGIAAWYLDVYQNERMKGATREAARAAYVKQIRNSNEWKQKHPGETP